MSATLEVRREPDGREGTVVVLDRGDTCWGASVGRGDRSWGLEVTAKCGDGELEICSRGGTEEILPLSEELLGINGDFTLVEASGRYRSEAGTGVLRSRGPSFRCGRGIVGSSESSFLASAATPDKVKEDKSRAKWGSMEASDWETTSTGPAYDCEH